MRGTDWAALAASCLEAGRIGEQDVKAMRAGVYADGLVGRDEAERLLALAGCEAPGAWRDFLVEAVVDHVVHQEKPSGYISQDNADWLIARLAPQGVVETLVGLELLVTALEQARSSPETLAGFALGQVADAVIDGKGPLARMPGAMPRVVGRAEVDLLRRILYAFGGDGNVGISRAEAEVLFTINDRTVEEMNDPAWNDLFVKAMTNFVMCSSGYEAPSRQVALQHDSFFDRADPDIAGFFMRMVSGGMSAVMEAYGAPSGLDSAWEARTIAKEAAARRAEAIDADEAAWLAERMGKGRLLHDNERALLAFIKRSSPSIHPALQPLVDKVA